MRPGCVARGRGALKDDMVRMKDPDNRQRGQMMVAFTLALVLIMGLASVVLDVGLLRNKNQTLWNTLDAGALAGVSQLPGNGTAAQAIAMQYVQQNDPALPAGNVSVSFRCLLGDRNGDGLPDPGDIGTVCSPGSGAVWRCSGSLCVASCSPAAGNTCNTIVVSGTATVQYGPGNVIGIPSGTTQTVLSAACKGPCGASPIIPVDVVMIIDRTASMSPADVTDTRNAAKTLLQAFNPSVQRVALGLIGPSSTSSSCSGSPSGVRGNALTGSTGYGQSIPADLGKWIPVGLTGVGAPPPGFNESYLNADGTVNTNTRLVKAINCFNNPGGTGTNLSVPMLMATYYLQTYGRPGVKWGIILETDGQPKHESGVGPASDFDCVASNNAATAAKQAGIEVFTIGFGLDGVNNALCPDSSGAWVGRRARDVLASMATQQSVDNGCGVTENTDGDHFFCQPKSEDLNLVFKAAASALVAGSRLVQLP